MKTLVTLTMAVVVAVMMTGSVRRDWIADQFVVCDGFMVIQTVTVQHATYRQACHIGSIFEMGSESF